MPEKSKTLPHLARGVFEACLLFRQRIRRGFDIPLGEFRRDMQVLFEEMDAEAQKDPRLEKVYKDKGKYVLAGFVDDVVRHAEWQFSQEWRNHLLEKEFFNSMIAGNEIPRIMEEVTGNEEEIGLGELLFICLALGYRGRYTTGTGELEALRERLYRFLPQRLPDEETTLTPQAYDHTVKRQAKRLRPMFTLFQVTVLCVITLAVAIFVIVYQRSSRATLVRTKLQTAVAEYVTKPAQVSGESSEHESTR